MDDVDLEKLYTLELSGLWLDRIKTAIYVLHVNAIDRGDTEAANHYDNMMGVLLRAKKNDEE